MYETGQLHLREKTDRVKKGSAGENRTGIPLTLRNQFEAASGLSFEDVRIHYHSHKPERLQALAYTQGNHVYIAPGQEKHLRHELGHVVQQKRGLVRTTAWINGLPVNDDRGLEQQAEKGIIPSGQPVPEEGQDIVQGVFMRWVMGEDGERTLVETGRNRMDINSEALEIEDILLLLKNIRDVKLSGKLNGEIYRRLCGITDDGKRMEVLHAVNLVKDADAFAIDALDHDCYNELWRLAARMEWIIVQKPDKYSNEDAAVARTVRKLMEGKLSKAGEEENPEGNELEGDLAGRDPEADKFGKARYQDLLEEIESLEQLIDSAANEQNPAKKNQLKQLIEYAAIGYLRMRKRFEKDIIMRKMPLRHLRKHFRRGFGEGVRQSEGGMSLTDIYVPDMLPATYAAEKSRQVSLPVRGDLYGALTDQEPVRRAGEDVTTELAMAILRELQQSDSRERLVIYRGMGAREAISILGFFNSSKAVETEKAVMAGVAVNGSNAGRYMAALGKHYGERAQAEEYTMFRIENGDYANVLLAFVLKPGAKELLFSKSLLVLPELQREREDGFWAQLRRGHGEYGTVSASEGAKTGYIGMKPESLSNHINTYSLGIARQSRLLLQLLIERVEVKRILI